jgi:hypothetical protein
MIGIFCKHEWVMLSETVTKSKFESAIEAITDNVLDYAGDRTKLPWQLCDSDRKHIQTFSCNRCGKLKRFVEEI